MAVAVLAITATGMTNPQHYRCVCGKKNSWFVALDWPLADIAETLLKKAIKLQPRNLIIFGGLAQVKLDKAQDLIKNSAKQSALISLEEAKGFISIGLEIEPGNATLLSLEHKVKQILLLVSA